MNIFVDILLAWYIIEEKQYHYVGYHLLLMLGKP